VATNSPIRHVMEEAQKEEGRNGNKIKLLYIPNIKRSFN
jgi:hypothetical protein